MHRLSGVAVAILVLFLDSASAGTAFGVLPGGAIVSVQIDTPAHGSTVPASGGVNVTGRAAIGPSTSVKDTTLVYMIDRSGSMLLDSGDDCTGDGETDSRYACVQAAIKEINQSLMNPGSAVSLVGIGLFSSMGIPANFLLPDLDYGSSGVTSLVAPDHDGDGDGRADVVQAVDDLIEPGGFTCFGCGLNIASLVFHAMTSDFLNSEALNTNTKNILVFMSEGIANEGSLQPVAPGGWTLPLPPGVIIRTIALGDDAVCSYQDDNGHGTLQEIAAFGAPGSSCVESDFEGVREAIIRSVGSVLSSVSLTLDQSLGFLAAESPALPRLGPAESTFSTTLNNLSEGAHEICATAHASDQAGDGSVTHCQSFFVNAPPIVVVSDAAGVEGSAIAMNASVTDAGDSPAVAWSGAPAGVCSFSHPASVTTTFTCADDGDFTVMLTADDGQGGVASDTAVVRVSNAAPVVDAGSDVLLLSGESLRVNATFSDAGAADTHTASIDWADGSASSGLAGEHRYTETGLYEVFVCVTDDDGATGCDSLQLEVRRRPVAILIKPESLNIDSRGTIKVDLLPSPGFDPSSVMQSSVRFGYTGFETGPLRFDANANKVSWHFDRTLLGIPPTQPREGSLTLSLTGRLQDGTLFVGADQVRISK